MFSVTKQRYMNIEQIKQNILPEDRAMAAVHAECTVEYVDMILRGARNNDTETAKKVISKLTQLAKVNKSWKAKKAQLIAA